MNSVITEIPKGKIVNSQHEFSCYTPSPRGISNVKLHRPVSGLARFDSSPSQALAQWLVDESTLAYRCGGSTGIID